MAFELPVIASNVFGIPEMVSDGDEGYLVPAGDSYRLAERILWLVERPAVGREMGAKGHAKALRLFASGAVLPRHLDLAREVVARHSSANN